MDSTNWRGFIPNAHDTKIMSNYVDENSPNGLKQNSKKLLGYEQQSYEETTKLTGLPGDLPKGGRHIATDTATGVVTKQYRMNELTARHVFAYGTDDTICTSALYNFYDLIMEIEKTDHVYQAVEVKPAYLTARGFVDGCNVSIERLKELEKADDKVYEEARAKFETLLVQKGILDKMFEPFEELTAAGVKDACELLYGWRPETKVRNFDKLAIMINLEAENGQDEAVWSRMQPFIGAVSRGDLGFINGLMMAHFKRTPSIDMGSPKQMQKFLYDVLGLPIRVINKVTPTERSNNKALASACYQFQKAAMKGKLPDLTPEEWELIKKKAKTDDTAVDFAVALDAHGDAADILRSMQIMKTILTRRTFYYKSYPAQKHWKDGKIHSSMNQCATVTRRYSSSGPNLQQLPKKGEGVKIRGMIRPHKKNAIIVSLDFSGQELRLAAHLSQDKNMLACYIGENLKDIHSLTAAGAMKQKWGVETYSEMKSLVGAENMLGEDLEYNVFLKLRKHHDEAVHKLADDLRKTAKSVNFGAQYDAQALTLSYQLIIPVKDAQDFLDAKYRMFPDVETWKENCRKSVARLGYASTLLGARRHLHRLLQDRATQSKAERQGPNFEIQGSGAEMTKLAMAAVWDSGVLYDYDCRFIAPIHDELVFSIDRDHALAAIKVIHSCMVKQYADMSVPICSSISVGPDFGNQIECGEYYDAEAIKAALNKIAFEGWAEAEGMDVTGAKDRTCSDGRKPAAYHNPETETAWREWAVAPKLPLAA